jgi:hypothetical protein
VPRVTSRRDASTYGSAGIPGQGDYGLGVRTPVAMMAMNSGAFARYGFQLSRQQASAAWFVHVMHLTSKRGDIPWS